MITISLGWGVQSFGLAAMSALGVLPPIDMAIHADTTHERGRTYEFAKRWTPWLEARGVQVVTVKGRRLAWREWPVEPLPAFLTWPNGRHAGMFTRQCTGDWKIDPIKKHVSTELRRRNLKKTPGVVEQWLGITLDEIQRMKPSRVKYIKLRYPFVEMFDPPMSRWQVARRLEDSGLEIPVRSSCVFCPFHDDATWRELKIDQGDDWNHAVEVDKAIRNKRPGYVAYVHRNRIPLEEVDMRDQADHGQLELWSEECEGYCFL